MEISTIKDVLEENFQNQSSEFRKKFLQRKIFFCWEKIVPPIVANDILPLRIDKETLIVHAKNSVAKDSFKFLAEEILQTVNKFLGGEVFKNFRFSRSFERMKITPRKKKISKLKKIKIELSAKEITECEKKVEQIKDSELKKISLQLFIDKKKSEKIKLANGWKKCKICGMLCAPEEIICDSCIITEKNKMREEIRKIFYRTPNKSYPKILAEIQKKFPHTAEICSEEIISSERSEMIRELAARVSVGDNQSDLAKTLVMIYKCVPKERLTTAIMNRALYELRFDLVDRINFS